MNNKIQNDFLLNAKIFKDLEKIIQKKNISNAYIFYGPDGIGKKETALKFITKLLDNDNNDLKIEQKIKQNNHPDYFFIEPTYLIKGASINQSELNIDEKKHNLPLIRIDQIRNIRDFISKKSIQSEKKIILIDDAHHLNEASSNCLLKTLEEPTNGLFILLTSKINLLLDTILSRCQKIKFPKLTQNQLRLFLKRKLTEEEYKKISNIKELIYLSNGSPSNLFQRHKAWNEIPALIKENINYPIKDLSEILILSKAICEELNYEQQEYLIDYIQLIWWKKIGSKRIIEILEDLKSNLKRNIQPRLSWEINLIKISMSIYPELIH